MGRRAIQGAPAALVKSLMGVIWPRRCFLCGDSEVLLEGAVSGVDACALHAPPLGLWDVEQGGAPGAGDVARCGSCLGPLPPGMAQGVARAARCQSCRQHPPAFATTLAAFDYGQSGIAEWILRFKHGGRRDLALPIARMMLVALEAPGLGGASVLRPVLRPVAGDFFIPVPLHPARLFERGYDQAALLADGLARELQGHALPLLCRTRATHVQGEVGAPPRRQNVRGAFGLRCKLPAPRSGRGEAVPRWWLVDDVMTSGATASACASVLRSGGAPPVHVLAIARA
jgi:predicted amidophosphoribosyltransferase